MVHLLFLEDGEDANRGLLAFLAGGDGRHGHHRLPTEHIGLLVGQADQDADGTKRRIILPQVAAGGERSGGLRERHRGGGAAVVGEGGGGGGERDGGTDGREASEQFAHGTVSLNRAEHHSAVVKQ